MLIGMWLRQQREARSWPRREMARRLTQAAQATGDVTLPGIEHLCTYIRRWEFGRHDLTERYKLYYCTAFGIRVGQFGKAPPPDPDRPLPVSGAVAYREEERSGFAVEQEVAMAAHEASDHAEQAGQPGMGEATAEQLHADVVRLAQLTDTGEPLAAFLEMRRVRDRIYRLLDRQLWPRERADLYFHLGCVNGLMGVTVGYLGYPDAAAEQIRSGWAYANAIDHRPLIAQLRCRLSAVAYWRGRFGESRDQAVRGLEYASDGPPAAKLHVMHARAAASLGDVDTARQAIADANRAQEHEYTDDLMEIGGEFSNALATHHLSAGSTLADVGGAEREASAELEQADELYNQGPRRGEQHWFAGKPLVGINLARVRLRMGALDGAAAALEPALSLPVTQRITQVTSRLASVREELAAPVYRGSAQARDMGEQIEEFGRETIVTGLRTLSGLAS